MQPRYISSLQNLTLTPRLIPQPLSPTDEQPDTRPSSLPPNATAKIEKHERTKVDEGGARPTRRRPCEISYLTEAKRSEVKCNNVGGLVDTSPLPEKLRQVSVPGLPKERDGDTTQAHGAG